MGKKKTNPNKIPVSWSEADTHRATDESTREMVLLAWALVLCAVADRRDTTTDTLLAFWNEVNDNSSKLNTVSDIKIRLDSLEKAVGIRFPFQTIPSVDIRTKADANRLCRRLRSNALSAMFALIADTVTELELMDQEMFRWVFEKVNSRLEDIEHGDLSIQDLLGVLEDEFSLQLVQRSQNVMLERIDAAPMIVQNIDTDTGICREEAQYGA